ncbi:uncharacterized protein LOC126106427 [Schistocerca cancellata]|uniref:uncharacterized protein LOC126106427 n=1 Tax=Schistocerca cancellata TaxID=274614 RepID=UPI002117E3A6|nr:uncharacterized protein LOC126106427 [Schistocerca cancellata]
MYSLPVSRVSRPDTVQLSGTTTLKKLTAIYHWTVSGFDICPEDAVNIGSPVFSHPNLSKWCMELENDNGRLMMCFRLVASDDSLPVTATLEALVSYRDGTKHSVYSLEDHNLKVNERSSLQCLTDNINTEELGDNWSFECEVCIVEVVAEDTTEEELESDVAKDLEQLMDSKFLSDITLSAGGVRLDAHRAILCARSPVFRAMLSHDTKEALEGLVEISDTEQQVVSEMLRYMYTDKVCVQSDLTEQLLVVFDKYGLQDAKVRCEMKLARQVTVDSAADIAALAIAHTCSFLQKVCVAFIKQNLEQVVGSRGWANIIDRYPEAVKTICESITEGSERCSSPATSGAQSDATTVNSPAAELTPEHLTPATRSGSLDTVRDAGYTHCERRKMVYIWEVMGLLNWPKGRNFVSSAPFWHPETIQWELRLYNLGEKYHVKLKLLENKAAGDVRVGQSFTSDPQKRGKLISAEDIIIKEGSEGKRYFLFSKTFEDVCTIKYEISLVCAVQQCGVAVKPAPQSDLKKDLHSLLESGNSADFKLCTGNVETGAHRAILAARSPFFSRLLRLDSEVSKESQLEVPDVKPEVLAEILRYIYTGSVKNLGDSTAELLAAAHRFELCDLKRECATRLSRQLTVDNAVTTVVCAIENQCGELLNSSVEFIRLRFKQVVGTAKWIEAIDTHPAALKEISQWVAAAGKTKTVN